MKKLMIFLTGITLTGSLTGCGGFDASGYVNAILNNSYYNDSTALVEQAISTTEEAAAVYEAGMKAQMDEMLTDASISEALYQEYFQLYKELYASVKFTVGEAVKVDNETFEVTVSYEKMQVFAHAIANYEIEVAEFVDQWTAAALAGEEKPSDEEMNEHLFRTFKDCIAAELAELTYAEPQTMVIKVELVDKVWTANYGDLLNLEEAMFDIEKLYGAE